MSIPLNQIDPALLDKNRADQPRSEGEILADTIDILGNALKEREEKQKDFDALVALLRAADKVRFNIERTRMQLVNLEEKLRRQGLELQTILGRLKAS